MRGSEVVATPQFTKDYAMWINTDICNAALRLVGQQAITSIDDSSAQAWDCKQFYDTSLDSFLAEFAWSFATREVQLPRIVDQEYDNDGTLVEVVLSHRFKYAHALPPDYVRLKTLLSFEYDIYLYKSQLAIYSGREKLVIEYISRDIPYDTVTPAAREAIIYRLAMYLDSARNGSINVEKFNGLYQNMVMTAKSYEPVTHRREELDRGQINRVRHFNYGFTKCGVENELRQRRS